MIGRVAGRIDYRASDHVLIDARGVGYLVYCSDRTLQALPAAGEYAALYTELLVRDDLLQLIGFTTLIEKEWHRLLTTVQGVGVKASLSILGTLGPDAVGRAITLGDWNAVTAAKGVGPKTAQRVINELKDKAPEIMAMGSGPAVAAPVSISSDEGDVIESGTPAAARPSPAGPGAQAEALSALTNLGYGPGEAAGAVAQAASDAPNVETTELIRAALKLLAPQQ